ncbi:sorting nexin-22 [Lepeophtheirus salmonis]|nr:sorting nexin-24-like [Lepeophtheirus salmonis]
MVGMPAHVDIPHYRWAFNEKKRKYVEYRIDFWLGDGSIYVQKYARYSQLHIFHSKIRSLYRRVPEFPPKKLRNNESSFIEIRRKDLSEYLRNIVQREDLGHSLLNFFRIRNTQRSQGSDKLIYPIMGFLEDEKSSTKVCQICYRRDIEFPNVAIQGVLESFYGEE